MNVEELLPHRVAELCLYFRGRYGPRWRTEIRKLARYNHPSWLPSVQRGGRPPRIRIPPTLVRAEALARSFGWQPVDISTALPFRRKAFEKYCSIVRTLQRAVTTNALREHITVEWIIREFIHRKTRIRIPRSDLIPLHWLTITYPDQKKPSGGNVPPLITQQSLLNRPVLKPQTILGSATKSSAHVDSDYQI